MSSSGLHMHAPTYTQNAVKKKGIILQKLLMRVIKGRAHQNNPKGIPIIVRVSKKNEQASTGL